MKEDKCFEQDPPHWQQIEARQGRNPGPHHSQIIAKIRRFVILSHTDLKFAET